MMKNIVLALAILCFFGFLLGNIFRPFLKRIEFTDLPFDEIFNREEKRHDKRFINTWVEDEEKTEAYLKRNYPHGIDSFSVTEFLNFRKKLVSKNELILFDRNRYESRTAGVIGEMIVFGEWYTTGTHLVLKERIKKNPAAIFPDGLPEKLATFRYKIIDNKSAEITLLLDIKKSKGLPRELTKPDTIFLKTNN